MALQPQDHGVSIFRHRATNRPTASLAAEVRLAATPKAPGQAVKAAATAMNRQRGRVGGLPQKQPVEMAPSAPTSVPSLPSPPSPAAPTSTTPQRIGYFGPRGGGIVTLPSNP